MSKTSPSAIQVPGLVPLFSGVLAGAIACGVPLVQGVASGWSAARLTAYCLLTLAFLIVITLPAVPHPAVQLFCANRSLFVLLAGMLCLGLQALSGDPYVQPIAFSVPFVHAAFLFQESPRRVLAIGGLYLGMVALGQALYGWREASMLLVPVASYLAVFGFMYAFVGLSITQAAARQHADALAADLARERDYLARLIAIDALLTRELNLPVVMGHIAAAGRALAHASQVRVWLREADEGTLRLAASDPAEAPTSPCADVTAALHATAPHNNGALLVLPLLFESENLGALELRQRSSGQFSPQDVERLTPFANAAAVAIRNAQLYQQAGLTATLSERNRLARELHDTIAQGLTATTMQIDAAQRALDRDPERARARLQRASDLSRATLDDVRRSVWTLASPLIDGSALGEALAEHCADFAERTGIATTYSHRGPPPQLEHTTASQVLRIAQEALHNCEKHAHASGISVHSCSEARHLRLSIHDNGIGFDPEIPNKGGFGLISLRERARLIGGELTIISEPGRGTTIELQIADTE